MICRIEKRCKKRNVTLKDCEFLEKEIRANCSEFFCVLGIMK